MTEKSYMYFGKIKHLKGNSRSNTNFITLIVNVGPLIINKLFFYILRVCPVVTVCNFE